MDKDTPKKMEQYELFVMDIFDAAPKSDQMTMEFPVFSLSKQKDTSEFVFENKANKYTIVPSSRGRANMWDKNVLIFCGSQIVASFQNGETPSRRVIMPIYDFLKFTNTSIGEKAYKEVINRLVRLKGTQIIWESGTPDGMETAAPISLIDDWRVKNRPGQKLVGEVEILLPEWFYQALEGFHVLTLPRRYFELTRPLEMQMYNLARKHCGKQRKFTISFDNFFIKLGLPSNQLRKFRKELVDKSIWSIIDYDFIYSKEEKMVQIINRRGEASKEPSPEALNR